MATVLQSPTAAQLAKVFGNDQNLTNAFLLLLATQGLFPGLVVYSAAQLFGGPIVINGQTIALPANGAAVSRQTYQRLLGVSVAVAPVTITHATPAVVTMTAHGLSATCPIYFTTNVVLPAPLVAGTEYFVRATITANTFEIAATSGGAAINTTTDGSGTHTATAYPFGIGDGSTTFNVPNVPAVVAGVNAYVIV